MNIEPYIISQFILYYNMQPVLQGKPVHLLIHTVIISVMWQHHTAVNQAGHASHDQVHVYIKNIRMREKI